LGNWFIVVVGQMEKDVVEGRTSQSDVVEADTGVLEVSEGFDQRVLAIRGRDRRPVILAVHVELTVPQRFESRCRGIEELVVIGDQLDDVPA
jgi:hypothetical protein